MKTLQVFFGLSVATALLGASVAMAEIRHESLRPLMFSVDVGDASITLPEFSFCSINDQSEEAQATCMMTPGGNMPDVLMELPVVPIATPVSEGYTSAQAAITPVSMLRTPPYSEPRWPFTPPVTPPITPPDDPDDPPPPPPVVPEPATLVLIGLGIGGALVARRQRRKN